jgi:hypothetical protein
MKAKWLIATAVVALLVGGIGTATAKQLLTGSDIKDGSLTGRDIKEGGISLNRLSEGTQEMLRNSQVKTFSGQSQSAAAGPKGDQGSQGAKGDRGPKGDKGDKGEKGDNADLPTAGHWGVIDRNTIGSPEQELRSGPAAPPNGDGSLNLAVQGAPAFTTSAQQEKAAFGNEQDFLGKTLASITDIGFWVFTTGENAGRGTPNMPTINIEVDRNGAAAGAPGFSTLVFSPANSTPNQWSDYIDGTTVTPNPAGPVGWYYTGTGNTCTISSPCTLAGAKADHPDATILTVAVTKGRDFAWQGAIDALRINGTVFDFEEHGVSEEKAV